MARPLTTSSSSSSTATGPSWANVCPYCNKCPPALFVGALKSEWLPPAVAQPWPCAKRPVSTRRLAALRRPLGRRADLVSTRAVWPSRQAKLS
eukprot:2380527-Alexandrium_andersonii.AAC.1